MIDKKRIPILAIALIAIAAITATPAIAQDSVEIRGEAVDLNAPNYPGGTSGQATWTANNFAGFYYDLDEDTSYETLKVQSTADNNFSDSGSSDRLVYTSTADSISIDFEHGQGLASNPQGLALFGEPYIVVGDDAGELSKILKDEKNDVTLTTGESFELEEGYTLVVEQVDVDGNKVMLTVKKDGTELETIIVDTEDDKKFAYEASMFGDDRKIIQGYVDSAFRGETNAIILDGIFQVSDEETKVETDDEYGKLEVTDVTSSKIEMKNPDKVTLNADGTVTIYNDFKLKVNDYDGWDDGSDDAIFFPIVEKTAPGTYNLRGATDENRNLLVGAEIVDQSNDGNVDDLVLNLSATTSSIGNYTVVVNGTAVTASDLNTDTSDSNVTVATPYIVIDSWGTVADNVRIHLRDNGSAFNLNNDEGVAIYNSTSASDSKFGSDIKVRPRWTSSHNAYDFAGFLYDLDTGNQFETLNINPGDDSKLVETTDLVYTSTVDTITTDFEHGRSGIFTADDSGKVNGLALFGEEYVKVGDDAGELSKILNDEKDDVTLTTGESLELEEGYSILIEQVDVDGNKVMMAVKKDGSEVDSLIVDTDGDQNFSYETEMFGDDRKIIQGFVDSAFRGETNAVIIDGYFQVSDQETEVETDDTFGKLEVTDVTGSKIEMKNSNDITLSADKSIEVNGQNLMLMTNDYDDWDTDAIYYPVKQVEVTGEGEPADEPTETPAEGEPTATPTETPAFEPDLELGAEIYADTCEACHGADGTGNLPGQPDFTDPSFWEGENQEELFDAVYNGLGAMPAQSGTYSEDEVKSAIAHESMEFGGVAWSDIAETGATPTATPTDTAAPTDTATAEPTDTGEDEEPTPTGTSPGFTALFAVAGLLAVAYTVARRKH